MARVNIPSIGKPERIQPFPIGDFEAGFQGFKEPWLLPRNAFTKLHNFLPDKGRIEKREGETLHSELGYPVTGETAYSGGAITWVTGTLANTPLLRPTALGFKNPIFTSGGQTIQGYMVVPTIKGLILLEDAASPGVAIGSAWVETGTFAFAATSTTLVTVDYEYRKTDQPVMGIQEFKDSNIGTHVIACDTRNAFEWDGTLGHWDLLTDLGADPFQGDDTNHFDFAVYDDYLIFVNGIVNTRTGPTSSGVFRYNAITNALEDHLAPGVDAAKGVVTFKGRVVYLHMIESANRFKTRATWTDIGNSETIPTKNRVDARAPGAIISWSQMNDDIIVFFEQISKSFHYTGDDVLPFEWLDIIGEYGAIACHSAVRRSNLTYARSRHDLVITDGAQIDRYDKPIEAMVHEWNQQAATYSYAAPAEDVHGLIMTYAAKGDALPESALIVTFEEEVRVFSTHDLPGVHVLGTFGGSATPTWDSYEELWDDMVGSWDDLALEAGFPVTLGGLRDGRIMALFTGEGHDGLAFKSEAKSIRLNPYPWTRTRLHYVDIYCDASEESQNVQLVFYRDARDAPYLTKSVDISPVQAGATKVKRRIPVNHTAAWHSIEVIHNGKPQWGWDAIVPWMSPAGAWSAF